MFHLRSRNRRDEFLQRVLEVGDSHEHSDLLRRSDFGKVVLGCERVRMRGVGIGWLGVEFDCEAMRREEKRDASVSTQKTRRSWETEKEREETETHQASYRSPLLSST